MNEDIDDLIDEGDDSIDNCGDECTAYGHLPPPATHSDHVRENCELGLVEAKSPADAEDIALEIHCPDGFEQEDQGVLEGNWIDWRGHSAFQLGYDGVPDVDQNCVFWIESVIEVPETEAVIFRKYLGKDWSKIGGKQSLPEPAIPPVPTPRPSKTATLTMHD